MHTCLVRGSANVMKSRSKARRNCGDTCHVPRSYRVQAHVLRVDKLLVVRQRYAHPAPAPATNDPRANVLALVLIVFTPDITRQRRSEKK